jgi:glycerol-3-phosphate acyltransferase PlsY
MEAKIISLIIGYVSGCFLTAEAVARHSAGKCARDIGSGNPGMANIMTNLGFRAGILVLAGDLGKTIAACLISYFIFQKDGSIIRLYAGLGVVLGHNFPFWNRFRGGKGVSATCMALAMYMFWPGVLCDMAGMFTVIFTGWLPLGAVVIPVAFLFPAYMAGGTEALVIDAVIAAVMFSRHYRGLDRIVKGEEKKIMDLAQIKDLYRKYTSRKK